MAIERATRREFRNRHGMRLVADEIGPTDGPIVLLLHGGGQTRASWGMATARLGEAGFRAITLDLRGHGESGWAPDGCYGFDAFADDLRDVLAALPPKAALVGASLGGLASLLVAGSNPDAVRALVLVDVVPQLELAGGREIVGFMTASPQGFASVEEAADAVAAYLPNRPRPNDTRGLLRNLRQRADGRYYWHWDPAMMAGDRRIDAGREALDAAARAVTRPTLLIRGGRSRVVSMAGVKAFQALIPHAEFVNVDEADHMVAGDANDAFNVPLIGFLDRTR